MAPPKKTQRDDKGTYQKGEDSLSSTGGNSSDEEGNGVDEPLPHFGGTQLGDGSLRKSYSIKEDLAVALGKKLGKTTRWIQLVTGVLNTIDRKRHERSAGSVDSRWCRYLNNPNQGRDIYPSIDSVISHPEVCITVKVYRMKALRSLEFFCGVCMLMRDT